ncbi:MAG: redoxin family protein [Actinomycetota bacterium]
MTRSDVAEATTLVNFQDLLGVDGERYSGDSFKHKAILAMIFTGNACPTAKAWDGELARLQRMYDHFGLQIVMVNSNNSYLSPEDTYDRMVIRAKTGGFNFPYVKDEGAVLAKQLGATVTPQVFVFDAVGSLRYAGRLADSRRPAATMRYDLKEAVEELAAGLDVTVESTEPFGCALVL